MKNESVVTTASDVLNLALQDAPEIGHEYGYGDLAADLLDALCGAGYTIVPTAAWTCPLCRGRGMLLVTYATGRQQITPCYPSCVRNAGLNPSRLPDDARTEPVDYDPSPTYGIERETDGT